MSENSTIPASPTRKPSPDKRAKAKDATSTKSVIKGSEKKGKKAKVKVEPKVKVVRDSFTMPQSDYSKLSELKLVCWKAGLQVKKSELLRAGLLVLSQLSTAQLKKTIAQIEQIKTGRPKMS